MHNKYISALLSGDPKLEVETAREELKYQFEAYQQRLEDEYRTARVMAVTMEKKGDSPEKAATVAYLLALRAAQENRRSTESHPGSSQKTDENKPLSDQNPNADLSKNSPFSSCKEGVIYEP